MDVPRDRNGEFEPKLIPKYQRDISGIEEKVISLYARGMSTRDIHDQLQELYGIELSAEMVSKITDKILPQVKEWQPRPLAPIYPFIFMDCIHYKVREDGRILSRAAYVVLGVTTQGYKDILSITVGANETSKFWLGMNYYTARRLGDMADSLNQLARAFDDGIEKNGQLTKDDGLAAMQASAALVCENCSRCNLYADSEKEDSYYLYYLLRAFEQKGHIDFEDMPQMFQSGCRKKEDYLAQLNRSLGRATMNLSWKNRFLESRDAVISQFRELSVILEEFSRQIDRARDITDEYEYILKKHFRRYHVALGNLLLLEYENGQKEAFLTVRTTNGRCITSKDAALINQGNVLLFAYCHR